MPSLVSSLYIHIPFCRSKCPYCSFYSVLYDKDLAVGYVDVLIRQISDLPENLSTIYIGGGTPTVLDRDLLARLLNGIKSKAAKGAEWTVEANPESLNIGSLELFLESGVNRLSIGAQSFNDAKLSSLGRAHDSQCAQGAVSAAVKCGFKNIGIDLIFGAPSEALDDWRADLARAVDLPVQHISCYGLTYEEGTPFFREKSHKSVEDFEDLSVRMYELAIDYLKLHGFLQYEVSNFAKSGYLCRHNLNYWDNGYYYGLGASAVSYLEGVRRQNISCVKSYLENSALFSSQEKLGDMARAKEFAAVKIRTNGGINYDDFKEKSSFDFLELEGRIIIKLVSDGLLDYNYADGKAVGIHLTRKGFLFADTVSSALL